MTINTTARTVEYLGDGVSTTFAVPYQFFEAAALAVATRDDDGVETALELTTDFTVTGGNGSTGAVVCLVAPLAGLTVVIRGAMTVRQDLALPYGGSFPTTSMERALDRLAVSIQEVGQGLGDIGGRALRVPFGETVPQLAKLADRVNTIFAFGPDGLPYLAPVTPVDLATLVSISDEIVTVAANVAPIGIVAANVDEVVTVATYMAGVLTVAASIANVNLVGGSIANVNLVGGSIANVNLVGGSIANVNLVGGSIANVNAVATDMALGAGASFILRAPQAAIDAANSATASAASAALAAMLAATAYLPAYAAAIKSAVGPGTLKCLLDMDGPKTFASGVIINSMATLDDTPLTFSGTRANMYSGADPKPVYNARGIYLSSQAGFDIANGLLSKTSGDFALLYACDLNTLTATIGTEAALPVSPAIVEGDMTLVNADRNVAAGMGADVALVLDQQFSGAQLVNGYFRGQGNTQTQQRGDYYLLVIKGVTSYLYFRVSHLGQIAVVTYSGAGGEVVSHSLGTVLFGQSKLLIGMRRYRGTLSFVANGRTLEGTDISGQASITDFANLYVNGTGPRSLNVVQPIPQGLRHYMKGFIVADDVPEQNWCQLHDVVARRFAMPELI